ncbi:MAG TPA: type II toxin-antitoxin system VapC family toxin [Terracidiphilus sp.]|nr:type II toxin-antitoxin system VapC family toxin [Terracidiphilus sp.]
MSGNLLDTNAVLFALVAPERLSAAARRAILKGPNVLSVVSYWEVLLKSMKGTLDVGDPRGWWKDALDELAAAPLLLRPEHIAAVYALPMHHKDPFDRVLIAQAKVEGLALVTSDAAMTRYVSSAVKIVR